MEEESGLPVLKDESGQDILCLLNETMIPMATPSTTSELLKLLKSYAESISLNSIKRKARKIETYVNNGNDDNACKLLGELIKMSKAQKGDKKYAKMAGVSADIQELLGCLRGGKSQKKSKKN